MAKIIAWLHRIKKESEDAMIFAIKAISNKLQNPSRRCIIIVFWLIAIWLGIIHAWSGRHTMNPDGISYLDIGDAYFRRDWHMALNAFWSPFYSWLLGLIMFLVKPSGNNEFTIVHVVNFVIYLFALASFHYFLIGLMRFRRNRAVKISNDTDAALPEEVLLALGYALFIWSSLTLITIERVTPDMCLSAFVYLISGILLRIRMGAMSWFRFIVLGTLLGFSYLSKSFMFILSFIFLASSVFLPGNLRKAIPRTAVALASFLLIASPFIIVLSHIKGHFTFGDAGKLNYVWNVNQVPYPHYLEDAALKHPVRRLSSMTEIYEFGTPIHATYPLHYDPSYWYEGIKVNFDLGKQILTLEGDIKGILSAFRHSIIIYVILMFCFMGFWKKLLMKGILEYWFLIIPAVLALIIYSLVRVASRYIGPFIVLLSMGFFSAVRLRDFPEDKRWMTSAVICMLLLQGIPIGTSDMKWTCLLDKQARVNWQIANAMKEMGFRSGDKICYFGNSFEASYWARLARLQIVAETQGSGNISFSEANRLADPVVIESLVKIKAKAIVVLITSKKSFSHTHWEQIGNTDYYVYFLKGNK
jgi:hypothetical protein